MRWYARLRYVGAEAQTATDRLHSTNSWRQRKLQEVVFVLAFSVCSTISDGGCCRTACNVGMSFHSVVRQLTPWYANLLKVHELLRCVQHEKVDKTSFTLDKSWESSALKRTRGTSLKERFAWRNFLTLMLHALPLPRLRALHDRFAEKCAHLLDPGTKFPHVKDGKL